MFFIGNFEHPNVMVVTAFCEKFTKPNRKSKIKPLIVCFVVFIEL